MPQAVAEADPASVAAPSGDAAPPDAPVTPASPSAAAQADAPAGDAPAPSSESEGSADAPQSSAPARPPLSEYLASLTPDEKKALRKDPLFAGILGAELDRERKTLKEQARKELEQEAERQRLREAAEQEDVVTLGEHTLKQLRAEIEAENAQKADAERKRASLAPDSDAYQAIGAFVATLPKSVQDSLKDPETGQGKAYPGSPVEGFQAFLADVVDQTVQERLEGELTKRLSAREKELRAALEKEILGEANGREESPDLSGGSPASSGLTLERWLSMPFAERQRLRATPEGRAQINAMTAAA